MTGIIASHWYHWCYHTFYAFFFYCVWSAAQYYTCLEIKQHTTQSSNFSTIRVAGQFIVSTSIPHCWLWITTLSSTYCTGHYPNPHHPGLPPGPHSLAGCEYHMWKKTLSLRRQSSSLPIAVSHSVECP